MGFLRKLKKVVKKVAKVAIKTAPIWTSFIPGGTVAGMAIARLNKVRAMVGGLKGIRGGGRQQLRQAETQVEHEVSVGRHILARRGSGGGFRGYNGRYMRMRSTFLRRRRRRRQTYGRYLNLRRARLRQLRIMRRAS